jgi:hypothetical protein
MKSVSVGGNRSKSISALVIAVLCFSATGAWGQTTCFTAPTGLVGLWRGDGNGYDSAGTNWATFINGVGFSTGEVGQAFTFDASSAAVRVPAAASLNVGTGAGLTIEAWIKPSNADLEQNLVEWNNGQGFVGAHFTLSVPSTGGGPGSLWGNLVDISGVTHQISSTTNLVVSGVYQHVALSYNKSTGVATLYLNASVVAQTNVGSFTPYTASDLYVGSRPSGVFAGLFYGGAIDELGLYNRELSTSEIQSIYNAGTSGKCGIPAGIVVSPSNLTAFVGNNVAFSVVASGDLPMYYQWLINGTTIPSATGSTLALANVQASIAGLYSVIVSNSAGSLTSSSATLTVSTPPPCQAPPLGLVGWWKAEGNALDSIGGNNGTLENNTGFGTGVVGQAFVFNGANQWVEIPDAPALNPSTNLTLEAWVNVTGYPNTDLATIVTKFSTWDMSRNQYQLETHYDGVRLNFRALVLLPSGYGYVDGSTTIQFGTWYHVAMTYDGSFVKLYVNSALDGSVAASGTIAPTTEPLRIGGPSAGPWWFKGSVDEVSLYNRALSSGEIQAIYNAGARGKCVGTTPPSLITQPQNLSADVGSSATFSVAAAGSIPLSFQWQFAGTPILAATDSALTLNPVSLSNAGSYSVVITNVTGSITSSPAILTVTPAVPPSLITQPQNLTAVVGSSAIFSVSAAGSIPLSYQWQFGGTPIPSATSNALILNPVSMKNAGSYSVVITNVAGSITSNPAILTVTPGPAVIQVASVTAAPDGTVTIPVNLLANGNENAVGFTLNFNPILLTNAGVVLGSGSSGASLFPNLTHAASGQLGIALGLPAGKTFSADTQQLVVVSFNSTIVSSPTPVFISFGDSVVQRLLVDASGKPLPADFISGSVLLPASQLEGDTFPRPGGDGALTVSDWVLIGRYVARLDSPTNGIEFQKADCAPRETFGDGLLTVSDWVQAGRYVAGLDPASRVAGPTNEAPSGATAVPGVTRRTKSNGSLVRLSAPALVQGQTATVAVELEAVGNENALSFSLGFEPTKLTFVSATAADSTIGATLNVNARSATQGHVGFVLALKANQSFGIGSKQLVQVSFRASPAGGGTAQIAFTDQPVPRGLSDVKAALLATDYLDATLVINPAPSLNVRAAGKGINLSWPSSATGFVLQESSDPSLNPPNWNSVQAPVAVENDEITASVPLSTTNKFYRLYHP